MNNKKKKILFLLGHMPKVINDGHSLNAFMIINEMLKNYDCYVAGNYTEVSFLHGIQRLKGKIYNLEVKRNIFVKVKSVIFFKPLISTEMDIESNLEYINQIIQQHNIDVLHSIFFPSTSNLSKKIYIDKKIMTMPDLYSKHYCQRFKKNKKLKFLFNFLSFKLLEFKLRNNFQSVQFVNYSEVAESGFQNAECVPLLLPETKYTANSNKKQILLARSNLDNTLWFMKNIANKLKDYSFVILSNNKKLLEYYEQNKDEYQNIKLIKWVDDYDAFVGSIYLQVVINHIGTGQSSMVIQAFRNGSLVIGTKLAYRGHQYIPEELKTYFTTESQLISMISEAMLFSPDEYFQKKELAKKYIEKHFNNRETLNKMKIIYERVLNNEN